MTGMVVQLDSEGSEEECQKLVISSLTKRRLESCLKIMKDCYVDEDLDLLHVGLESKNRTDQKTTITVTTTKKNQILAQYRKEHLIIRVVKKTGPTFYKQYIFITSSLLKVKVAQSCLTLCDPMDCRPWNSPGQNTGVGSLSLPQGIFPTQGSNPGLLYCRQILYLLNHKGSPSILERVAFPFSRGCSRPKN